MKLTPILLIQIRTTNKIYIQHFIQSLKFILLKNKLINFKINNIPYPHKLKKISLLKSPHVHKTTWLQLESKKVSNTILITNFNKLEFNKISQIINFFKKWLIPNLLIKIKHTTYQII